MSNYTKSTDFASKDSLASGNAAKIVKGTEIDTEFNNIATAVATKADLASPTFTGTVTAGTVTAGTVNITALTATTATISGGSITGITDLAVADGGTGASTAANARANLGTVADTASNGIAARTASNTLTARTITAGTGISVTNGDGVSGDPTIANSGVTSVNGSTGALTVNDAKAWVNFNGTSTVAIRASFNVSSISDNGTGDYTVNFTSALADENYCAVFGGQGTTGANFAYTVGRGNQSTLQQTTTTLRMFASNGANAIVDVLMASVAIFR